MILSRFELLTSCLSSKRSKPTELKDQYFHCKDTKNDAKRNDPFEYSNTSIGRIVSHCFENSYIDAVSALVKDDKITVNELEELINRIKNES